MNNQLFVCEKHYLLLFLTAASAMREDAFSLVAAHLRDGSGRAEKVVANWRSITKEKVISVYPGEPIFLIEKTSKIGEKPSELWHVVVGENIGWLRILDWMEVKTLNNA